MVVLTCLPRHCTEIGVKDVGQASVLTAVLSFFQLESLTIASGEEQSVTAFTTSYYGLPFVQQLQRQPSVRRSRVDDGSDPRAASETSHGYMTVQRRREAAAAAAERRHRDDASTEAMSGSVRRQHGDVEHRRCFNMQCTHTSKRTLKGRSSLSACMSE